MKRGWFRAIEIAPQMHRRTVRRVYSQKKHRNDTRVNRTRDFAPTQCRLCIANACHHAIDRTRKLHAAPAKFGDRFRDETMASARYTRKFPHIFHRDMNNTYITVLVALAGAVSTLLGVLITSRTQIANQRLNNEFQIKLAREKARHDVKVATSESAAAQLSIAHKNLSQIAREFSLTGLDIMWTASMPVAEFNAKYLSLCEKADDLLMIVDFLAPEASTAAHEVYRQMNMFWGSFKNILYQSEKGKTPDQLSPQLQDAHKAAKLIGEKAIFAKNRLSQTFQGQFAA